MINGSGEQKKERSDDVFLKGDCSITSRLGPPPISSLAPPPRAPAAAIGRPECVFVRGLAAARVNRTSLVLFIECMSELVRDSADGLQQLTTEHFTQRLKEQRQQERAIQRTI